MGNQGHYFVAILLATCAHAHAEPLPKPRVCLDDGLKEQVRGIMLSGIDEALKQHTVHVFDIWLKDKTKQPERGIAGMRIGIEAYIRSKKAIQDWDPPAC